MIYLTTDRPEGFVAVMSLAEARRNWHGFHHVMTIEDPDFQDGLRIADGTGTTQTVEKFHDTDVTDGPHRAADSEQVRRLLLDARRHVGSRLLVHCLQGQCRSAAVALGIISDRLGEGREYEAIKALLAIRPTAVCNRHVLGLADGLLVRRGRLLQAWDAHLEKDDRAYGVMLLRQLAERQED